MVVIGGLGGATGAALGSLWIIGMPAFFPGNELVPLFSSSIGLLVLLMYFPGGILQIAHAVRSALIDWAEPRFGAPPAQTAARPASVRRPSDRPPATGEALVAEQVSVRFGGNTAVDHVTLRVGAGEIVGLIGTNGAGKTTVMNAISGLVPASGSIAVFGADVTSLDPAGRARRGLGRTFQAATLFPELTVLETVQVALSSQDRSRLRSSVPSGSTSVNAGRRRSERRRVAEAGEIITFLGLGRYATSPTSDLSTGTRRIVELAVLLALDARLLLLDEPTAGVAQRETEAFAPLIVGIRRELDAAVLIVEHDMPLITSISDRLYCMEAGAVIAEGLPDVVRHDPRVVASYLGTDERAIARSGAAVGLDP